MVTLKDIRKIVLAKNYTVWIFDKETKELIDDFNINFDDEDSTLVDSLDKCKTYQDCPVDLITTDYRGQIRFDVIY